MNRVFILVLLIFFTYRLQGQTLIKGSLRGSDGKAMAGLNVSLREKGISTVLLFAISDEKGGYQLSFKSNSDSLLLTVSGFSIARKSRMLFNKSQQADFELVNEAIKLKEIKVNPPKIRQLGDTLNYLVDVFKDQNDRTIGDVLKKMPGIVVKDDGSILYNNKPINKFYIENKDLLQGRYGIATNNIEAKDVASVQVLENHQPVKALKNKEFTDEGAINLKLKDSAKGVLTATGQLGTGVSPVLWNNELSSMYFDKNKQLMNVYKGNNTGQDAAADQLSFYGGSQAPGQAAGLSIQAPAAPGISQQRYLFNRSHAASLNQLWSYGKDYQLTANVNYLNDHKDQQSYSQSSYYLPGDSLLSITEQLSAKQQVNKLDASLQLNANREQFYLDNALKFSGSWIMEEGTLLTATDLKQELDKPLINLSNNFSVISNLGKKTIKLSSFTSYSQADQTLLINPLLYPDLFGGDLSSVAMVQNVAQNKFSTQNRISYGWTSKQLIQNYAIGMNAYATHFSSALQARSAAGQLGLAADSLRNDLQWNTLDVYFSPDYTYHTNKLRMVLNLPLSYASLRNNIFFNPSLSARYELSPLWQFNAAAKYNSDIGGLENGYRSYIMQSYRSLTRNDGSLPKKQSQAYNLDIGYRHPIHAVFTNFGASYSINQMSILYGYDYSGIRSSRLSYEIPNESRTMVFYGKFSKAIQFLESTFTLDLNYSNSRASQISQSELIDFSADRYGLNAGTSSKLSKWGSFSYNWNYSRSLSKIRAAEGRAAIDNHVHRGKLNVFPTKKLTLNLAFERFYNGGLSGAAQSMNFADAGAKFNWKRMEFNLEYNNLLNTKQYVMATYSDISTFYSSYNLRPAQVLMKVRFKIK